MQFLDLTASAKYFIKCLGDVDGWWVKALCILMNAALPTCVRYCPKAADQSSWGGDEGKNLLLQTVVGEENFSWTACRAWVICERQTNWRTVLPNTLFWEVPIARQKANSLYLGPHAWTDLCSVWRAQYITVKLMKVLQQHLLSFSVLYYTKKYLLISCSIPDCWSTTPQAGWIGLFDPGSALCWFCWFQWSTGVLLFWKSYKSWTMPEKTLLPW